MTEVDHDRIEMNAKDQLDQTSSQWSPYKQQSSVLVCKHTWWQPSPPIYNVESKLRPRLLVPNQRILPELEKNGLHYSAMLAAGLLHRQYVHTHQEERQQCGYLSLATTLTSCGCWKDTWCRVHWISQPIDRLKKSAVTSHEIPSLQGQGVEQTQ